MHFCFWLLASQFENHCEHSHHHHFPDESITTNSLIAVGIARGITPCPSAFILFLSAVPLHQVVYGILLISVFNLVLVLIILGLLAIYVYQWLEAFPAIMESYKQKLVWLAQY